MSRRRGITAQARVSASLLLPLHALLRTHDLSFLSHIRLFTEGADPRSGLRKAVRHRYALRREQGQGAYEHAACSSKFLAPKASRQTMQVRTKHLQMSPLAVHLLLMPRMRLLNRARVTFGQQVKSEAAKSWLLQLARRRRLMIDDFAARR